MRFGHFCLPTYFPDHDLPQDAHMRRLVDFFASSEDLRLFGERVIPRFK